MSARPIRRINKGGGEHLGDYSPNRKCKANPRYFTLLHLLYTLFAAGGRLLQVRLGIGVGKTISTAGIHVAEAPLGGSAAIAEIADLRNPPFAAQ